MSDKKLDLFSSRWFERRRNFTRWGSIRHRVLDFSTNINAYGPSPAGPECHGKPRILPDIRIGMPPYFVVFLVKTLGLKPDHFMIGNGTSELIWLVSYQFLKKGDNVLICSPTFSEYERCARLMMANVFHCKANPENNFVHTTEEIQHAITDTFPKLCFVCNPTTIRAVGSFHHTALIRLISKKTRIRCSLSMRLIWLL